MKKKAVTAVISLAIAGALAVEGWELYQLNSIRMLFSDVDYDWVKESAQQLNEDLDRYLENPESLILSCQYRPQERDEEQKSFSADFTVIPIKATRDMTAQLLLDDQRYPMALNMEAYRPEFFVQVELQALAPVERVAVEIVENGRVRTEELDLAVDTKGIFLPLVAGEFRIDSRNGEMETKAGKTVYRLSGTIDLNRDPFGSLPSGLVENIRAEVMVNGTKVQEFPLGSASRVHTILADVEVPQGGGAISLVIRAEDENYRYGYVADRRVFDKKGAPVYGTREQELAEGSDGPCVRLVLDKSGNEVYRGYFSPGEV